MAEAYQALYRKWRPQVFADVVGQEHVTRTLMNEVRTGRHSHAYLFTGSRGTGKTTCAKIFAKAVNCEHPVNGDPCNCCETCKGIDAGSILDVVEIDAASNNGVDNIREIRDEANFTPVGGKYRVYIIDEVHMLSTGAFNALLKTLEEPPEHVKFVLATTEVHKLPATILSRCQRFDFHRISPEDIAARLTYVAKEENLQLTPGAANLIARLADGALRDALSILDQCIGQSTNIDEATVNAVVGLAGRDYLFQLADSILHRNSAMALAQIDDLYNRSCDMERLCNELINHFRNLMVCKAVKNPKDLIVCSAVELAAYQSVAKKTSMSDILNTLNALGDALVLIRKGLNRRVEMEMALIRLCTDGIYTENVQDPVPTTIPERAKMPAPAAPAAEPVSAPAEDPAPAPAEAPATEQAAPEAPAEEPAAPAEPAVPTEPAPAEALASAEPAEQAAPDAPAEEPAAPATESAAPAEAPATPAEAPAAPAVEAEVATEAPTAAALTAAIAAAAATAASSDAEEPAKAPAETEEAPEDEPLEGQISLIEEAASEDSNPEEAEPAEEVASEEPEPKFEAEEGNPEEAEPAEEVAPEEPEPELEAETGNPEEAGPDEEVASEELEPEPEPEAPATGPEAPAAEPKPTTSADEDDEDLSYEEPPAPENADVRVLKSYEDGPLKDAIWNSIIREATAVDKPLIGCMSDAKAIKRGRTLLISTTNFLFKAVIGQDVHKNAIMEATRKVLGEPLTPRLVDENDILSFDEPEKDAPEADSTSPDAFPADLMNPTEEHKPERKLVEDEDAEGLYEVRLSEEKLAQARPVEDDTDVKVAEPHAERPNGPLTEEQGFSANAPTFNTLGSGLELPDDPDADRPHTTTFTLPDIDDVRYQPDDDDEDYDDVPPLPDDNDIPAPDKDLYPELDEAVSFRFADQELLGDAFGPAETPAQEPADTPAEPLDPADETREEDPLDDFLGNLDKLGVNYELED
ncbi:MAG: DNA polymerase III subunit gamma/tau [Acutalibacteraceae bacterium]|nr:DNA polymerase III subunit gamma/tau [Acutalibacteraceae bacterium]